MQRMVVNWRGWLVLLSAVACFAQVQPSPARPGAPTASVSAAGTSSIVPPPANYRFPDQSYVFSVEWHLFNAGVATVKLEDAGREKHVVATGHSSGVVNALFKVNDSFEANFDPHTFCSLRVKKHTEEGSRKRDTLIVLDYQRRKSVVDDKNLKTGELRHLENDTPGCVTDVISGFYYLASLPLEPGNVYTFPINDGKTTEVEARVEARERIKVPAGTYQAVRVNAEAITGPLQGKGSIWVWYSDDGNRIPLQMRSKLGWGTLLFRLQRIDKP